MTSETSLFRSLRIMTQVIGALLRRDMLTKFGRHNIGFLWLFGEPVLFIVAITIVMALLKGISKPGVNIYAFCLTGFSALDLFRGVVNAPGKCFRANQGLMHHRNVRVMSVYLSGIILEIAGSTI